MRASFISLVFVSCCLISVAAQSPYRRNHHLFSGKEDYNVMQILQDSTGFIWFGTDRGLFRFDGVTYDEYTVSDGLADDRISAICNVRDGMLWIGHKGGSISIYDGREFSVFDPEEGMGQVEITDIVMCENGLIWFSTMGEGLYRYDGRHLSNFNTDDGLSDDYVYDIEIDPPNDLWLSTDYGFSRFSNDTFQVISMKDGLPDNIVRTLQISGERIWLGTEDSGLSLYDPETGGFINYPNWTFGPVTGIIQTSEDKIRASTEANGIIQVQLNEDSTAVFLQISEQQGLISNRVHTVIKDSEENIWVGGRRGVVQILPPIFEFLDAESGTPFEMAYSLIKDFQGSIWVSSELGLFRGSKGKAGQLEWESISDRLHLNEVNFISLYEDPNHQIWAGSYGRGLFIIDPETLKYAELNTSSGLSDDNVINISGEGNKVWISTLGGGVNECDISVQEHKHFSHPDIGESYVYCTHPDQEQRIWIAGLLNYPYYVFNDSVYHLEDDSIEFPQLYGIASDDVGNTWFNTLNEGIIRISGSQIKRFGPDEGINLQEIQSIVFDKFNNMLLFANSGLQIFDPESGTSILIDENMGLGYRYPLLNSVYRDRNNQIWFGTETGIIKYDPDYLYITDQEPRLFISTMNLFDLPVDRSKTRYTHRSNNFTFGYTGLWFKNPEMLTFRYQLEGYDPDWNYYNNNRVISYPKLPPGSYTFRVEVSIDGVKWSNPEDAVFAFKITPPFWRRWWFILTISIVVVMSVLLYIRLRVANLKRAKKELEKEVRKRTAQIRNKNIALELQKEEIEAQRDHAEEQRDQIEHQNEEIQSSIRYAHRIQTAALPPTSVMNKLLDDFFVFNRPRDIVSGDFYWAARRSPHLFFSVADCTGHGVPGAFMSMLGLSALNDIVKSLNNCTASAILDLLAIRIRESLHQSDESEETSSNDGMDIALCIYDPTTGVLQFAGANNHLYMIRNGEMSVVRADKQDISSKYFEPRPFTNHIIDIQKGDCFYLFSDGFPDQFGGPKFKKYKYNKFREFLLSIHQKPMEVQHQLMGEELDSWMKDNTQVDDVIVMGLRIH